MGASTFCTFVREPNPTEAFRIAAQEAAYESGHGGYTGTVAEKHSFVVIDKVPRELRAAEVYAVDLIGANDPRIDDKWGPAGAIAVTDDPTPAATTTRQVKVRNADPTQLLALRRERHLELVSASLAASLAPNERVIAARLVSVDVALREQHAPASEPTSIEYAVTGYGYQGPRHATLEAARTEMAALADRARHDLQKALAKVAPDGSVPQLNRPTEYAVHAFVGSGFGQSCLERSTIVHDGETLTFEATVARYATDPNASTVGWVFFGWASD